MHVGSRPGYKHTTDRTINIQIEALILNMNVT